ncbi:MAG: type III secretion system inner membrane ring lipoprotein SctJ [Thiotrichales bacterium]
MALILAFLAGCKTALYANLNEQEANEMMSHLMRNGIRTEKIGDKKSGLYALNVDQSQFANAVEILKNLGLPKERFVKVDDLFKKEGLISSPLEERVRYIYALSQDVQETLAKIDGVLTARVHVVLPQNDPFDTKVKPSAASVFIKYLPDSQLEDIKSEIKLIVEKSIEGLSYDKVSVIMLPANELVATDQSIQWVNLWGVRLPQDSAGTFKRLVWGLTLLLLLCIGLIVYLVRMVVAAGAIKPSNTDSTGADSGVGETSANRDPLGVWFTKLFNFSKSNG